MVLRQAASAETAPLQAADLPDPPPEDDDLLVHVTACGVCHTDLHLAEGDLPLHHTPLVPGHQVVGRVVRIGPSADGGWLGRRVGIAWLRRACGACDACLAGNENLCPHARFNGWDADGGYAEACTVPAAFAHPLPEALSDIEAAPLLCAGIIGYRSLRLSGLEPGGAVGLFGFGASAHLALQVARHWGCAVYVFTRGEAHRRMALDMGAAWAGGAEQSPPRPIDAAVTFAPAGAVVAAALARVRPGGTVAVNAVHLDRLPEMPYRLLYGERVLRSVSNATRRDGAEFLALAAQAGIRARTEVLPLHRANDALLCLKRGRVDGALVLKI